ncbi:MAG: polysaccharide deacetylase family protein [Rhodomicrobiaceae bacterium]
MFRFLQIVAAATLLLSIGSYAKAADCADDPRTTGLSRTIAIDSAGGKFFGRLQYKESVPLRRGEVVLTFDDGPHPHNTTTILDILDRHCVKATFFTVGRMAIFMSHVLKDAARRGNTIATHTWSHPRDLAKLPLEEAKVEIEKGFVATSHALGQPIAPFFRYPGFNQSPELNAYLASRNISVWSVDVVSDDTMHGLTPEQLVNQAMERIRHMGRGIVLFHDLKDVTAQAMDSFLTQLKLEGFKVVHVVSNSAYKPNPELMARLDFSKQSLQTVAFTGVAPAGNASRGQNVLTTGQVDIMRNEFVDIDSSAIAEKQRQAASARTARSGDN